MSMVDSKSSTMASRALSDACAARHVCAWWVGEQCQWCNATVVELRVASTLLAMPRPCAMAMHAGCRATSATRDRPIAQRTQRERRTNPYVHVPGWRVRAAVPTGRLLLRRERERRTRYAKRFGHVLQRSFKQHLSYINGARAGGCRRKRRHTVRHSTGRACTRTPRSHADRLTCSPCGSGGSMELRFAKPRARGATFLGMLRCLQGIQIVPRVRRRRLQHGHLGDGV